MNRVYTFVALSVLVQMMHGGVIAFQLNNKIIGNRRNGLATTTTMRKSTAVNGEKTEEELSSSSPSSPTVFERMVKSKKTTASPIDDGSEGLEEEEEVTVTATASGVSNEEKDNNVDDTNLLLNSLLQIAARTGRGEFASTKEKDDALQLITKLEAKTSSKNTDDSTTESNMMYGTWELVYSSTQLFRSSPFFMAGRAVCSTTDQAKQYDWFCDMHRAALAISNIGTVRQIISSTEKKLISEFEVKVGSVPFLSDFVPFAKYSGGLPVTIDGSIVSTADIVSTSKLNGQTSLELLMDTVEIKGSNIPLVRQILDNDNIKLKSRDLGSILEENVQGYTNPKPIFTTTYLSDNIRISRDQDNKVFVYSKISSSETPTDYTSIDSDLGVLRLLEGINDSITKFYI